MLQGLVQQLFVESFTRRYLLFNNISVRERRFISMYDHAP
jgi:hypothetical protein